MITPLVDADGRQREYWLKLLDHFLLRISLIPANTSLLPLEWMWTNMVVNQHLVDMMIKGGGEGDQTRLREADPYGLLGMLAW